jgi:hypothetical protein
MTTSPNDWINNLPGPRLAAVVEKDGDRLKERHHTDDVYFAVWLHAVNRAVQRRIVMSYDDLEDWDYWSAYDAGMHPKDAAIEMLQDNGWDGGYDEEALS